jgi:hypothetical protein
MNRVKRQRPWIDLLKPEKNVVLGVLLTLDPGVVRDMPALLPVAWQRGRGELQSRGFLSAAPGYAPQATLTTDALVSTDAIGPQLRKLIDGTEGNQAIAAHRGTDVVDPMLLEIERQFARGMPARDSFDDLQGTLGWAGMLLDRLHAVDRVDALRRALLDWHTDDHSFELADEDETYRKVRARVGPDIDVIVTGHTHLERAILTRARAYYNTGTWIRVIRLPPDVLKSPLQFVQLYRLLEHASLADLDNTGVTAADGSTVPLVRDVTTALHVTATGHSVVATLGHVVDDAREGVRFERIAPSEFRRV